ncbi:MAG: hypothetical protein ACPGIA_05570 [Luteolibacter sp.]
MKLLLVGLIAASCLQLSARTFTSADGSKTIDAELLNYNPSNGTIVIQIHGQGKRSTVKANLFSETDQEYFKEFLKESEKFKALKISTEDHTERREEDRGIYIYDRQKEHFTVSIHNTGNFDMGGLEAKYTIYYQKYDRDGKKLTESVSGAKSLAGIESQDSADFDTLPVDITIDCKTTSSCPKCVSHASTQKRERVVGIHIQIYNEEDQMLSEYHSSNTIRAIVND